MVHLSKERVDWWHGPIPWVSPKDLKRPRLKGVRDHISEEAANSGSRVAPAGTVFMVVRGMILAKDIPVALTERPMAFNQDLKGIVPKTDLNGDFLLNAFVQRKEALMRTIGTSAHGTRRIGTGDIEGFLIPLPSMDEQRQISDVLRSCDLKVEALESEIKAFGTLFDTMLDNLMAGRLRPGS